MSTKMNNSRMSVTGLHILVVDDDPTITSLFMKILDREGYVTKTKKDGQSAIHELLQNDYELLIVDNYLPDMMGTDVIIRARAICPNMEVIVITGYASYESAIEALRLGVFDYLEKPFGDIGIVLEKVRRALEKHQILYENSVLANHLREAYSDISEIRKKLNSSLGDMEKVNAYLDEMIKWAVMEVKDENSTLKKIISRTSNHLLELQNHLDDFTSDEASSEASGQGDENPVLKKAKRLVRQAHVTISARHPIPTARISEMEDISNKTRLEEAPKHPKKEFSS